MKRQDNINVGALAPGAVTWDHTLGIKHAPFLLKEKIREKKRDGSDQRQVS
jgi:hypothetical protein